jgi:hypothetical protein
LYNNTYLTSYGVLKWRDENKPPNLFRRPVPFCFNFFLEDRGHLEITLLYLESKHMRINVLPEPLYSTNTLGIPVTEFSVILRIDKCKTLTHL